MLAGTDRESNAQQLGRVAPAENLMFGGEV